MKKHGMPEMKEGGVNVTPLIDIVMCLIIFFMLVAKIGVTRGIDKDIKLPNTILGTKIADLANTLSLNVHHLGSQRDFPQVTAFVNGVSKELNVKSPPHGDSDLLIVLREFKKTHGDKAQIILRGDADLDYGQLEQVLMAIATAGISDTAYETKNGPDSPEESAAPAAPAP